MKFDIPTSIRFHSINSILFFGNEWNRTWKTVNTIVFLTLVSKIIVFEMAWILNCIDIDTYLPSSWFIPISIFAQTEIRVPLCNVRARWKFCCRHRYPHYSISQRIANIFLLLLLIGVHVHRLMFILSKMHVRFVTLQPINVLFMYFSVTLWTKRNRKIHLSILFLFFLILRWL